MSPSLSLFLVCFRSNRPLSGSEMLVMFFEVIHSSLNNRSTDQEDDVDGDVGDDINFDDDDLNSVNDNINHSGKRKKKQGGGSSSSSSISNKKLKPSEARSSCIGIYNQPSGNFKMDVRFNGKKIRKTFDTEIEAGKAYDSLVYHVLNYRPFNVFNTCLLIFYQVRENNLVGIRKLNFPTKEEEEIEKLPKEKPAPQQRPENKQLNSTTPCNSHKTSLNALL